MKNAHFPLYYYTQKVMPPAN